MKYPIKKTVAYQLSCVGCGRGYMEYKSIQNRFCGCESCDKKITKQHKIYANNTIFLIT